MRMMRVRPWGPLGDQFWRNSRNKNNKNKTTTPSQRCGGERLSATNTLAECDTNDIRGSVP
jgi:hypothetical protein